jgi:hypothetical protein
LPLFESSISNYFSDIDCKADVCVHLIFYPGKYAQAKNNVFLDNDDETAKVLLLRAVLVQLLLTQVQLARQLQLPQKKVQQLQQLQLQVQLAQQLQLQLRQLKAQLLQLRAQISCGHKIMAKP